MDNLLSNEKVEYAIDFIEKRIKLADKNERPLLYGELQMLHIAKKALLKVQQDDKEANRIAKKELLKIKQDNKAVNCKTKPFDIEKMTGKKQ